MKKILNILLVYSCLLCLTTCYDNQVKKWKYGIIPYYYKDKFTSRQKTYVRAAICAWQSTGVKFIEVDKDYIGTKYRIEFSDKGSYSSSSVGVDFDPSLKLCKGCFYLSIIIHELGHCLGLQHEHCRTDRDNYITIVWKNIKDGEENNFKIKDKFLYDIEDYKYDFGSIMHYTAKTFSKNDKITIDTHGKKITRGVLPSKIDLQKIKDAYRYEIEKRKEKE